VQPLGSLNLAVATQRVKEIFPGDEPEPVAKPSLPAVVEEPTNELAIVCFALRSRQLAADFQTNIWSRSRTRTIWDATKVWIPTPSPSTRAPRASLAPHIPDAARAIPCPTPALLARSRLQSHCSIFIHSTITIK